MKPVFKRAHTTVSEFLPVILPDTDKNIALYRYANSKNPSERQAALFALSNNLNPSKSTSKLLTIP